MLIKEKGEKGGKLITFPLKGPGIETALVNKCCIEINRAINHKNRSFLCKTQKLYPIPLGICVPRTHFFSPYKLPSNRITLCSSLSRIDKNFWVGGGVKYGTVYFFF